MAFRTATIEKLGETCIRFGEAAVVGGVATLFVQNFPMGISLGRIFGGTTLTWIGLWVFDRADQWGRKSQETQREIVT